MRAEMRARINANLNELQEDIKYGQAEMRSISDAWMTDLKDGRKKKTACQEATKTEPNQKIM
jgi:hypothetical protein